MGRPSKACRFNGAFKKLMVVCNVEKLLTDDACMVALVGRPRIWPGYAEGNLLFAEEVDHEAFYLPVSVIQPFLVIVKGPDPVHGGFLQE